MANNYIKKGFKKAGPSNDTFSIDEIYKVFKTDPAWGLEYATKNYFQAGFLDCEIKLVKKYLIRPSKILVIGSGSGREAHPISKAGHEIFCMDKIFFFVQTGKSFFHKENVSCVKFLQGDMFHFPFKKESFDFIFFTLYSPAGKRRSNVLASLRQIIRPDGMVLLTTCAEIYPSIYPHFRKELKDWFLTDDKEIVKREVLSSGFELLESEKEKEYPYMIHILKAI